MIPAPVREAMAEHARDESPNEACGLIVVKDGVAERYVAGRNAAESPYRFELDVPPILDVARLDRKLLVTNAEAVGGLRLLLEREGVLGGVSSGAVVHAALRMADELDEGAIVCVLADGGWKYLSADFWDATDVDTAMGRSVWW